MTETRADFDGGAVEDPVPTHGMGQQPTMAEEPDERVDAVIDESVVVRARGALRMALIEALRGFRLSHAGVLDAMGDEESRRLVRDALDEVARSEGARESVPVPDHIDTGDALGDPAAAEAVAEKEGPPKRRSRR